MSVFGEPGSGGGGGLGALRRSRPIRHPGAWVQRVAAASGVAAVVFALVGVASSGAVIPVRAAIVAGTAAVCLFLVAAWAAAVEHSRLDALVGRVSHLAMSGQPLTTVLDGILEELARGGLRGASIALVTDAKELYIAAAEGDLSDEVRALRLPVGDGIMGRVALTGRSVRIDDLDHPPAGIAAANRRIGSNARMRSLVAVPIRLDGDAFGVLEIDSHERGRFTDADVALLERIALAIGGAVLQAGPLRVANETLRRRVRELSLLLGAGRTLGSTLDAPTIAEGLLQAVAEGLVAPVAVLLRRGGHGLILESAAGVAAGREIEDLLGTSGDGGPALDGVLRGDAARELDVAALAASPALTGIVARLDLRRAAAAAVRWDGSAPDAVIVAASPADRRFDDSELALLSGLVAVADLALANAQRFRALTRVAEVDALTGLSNLARFERALAEARPGPVAVVAVDVDRLKEVNDAAGHEAGDEALRSIATAIGATAGGMGIVARTGGDEFAILLEGVGEVDATALAERIRTAMHGVPVAHGLARVSVGVAAGDGAAARATWWRAMDAVEAAKNRGRDMVATAAAGASMSGGASRRWDAVLASALEQGRLAAVYQPVVELAGRRVVAYEALARPLGDLTTGVDGLFAAAHRRGRLRDLDWACRRAGLDGARTLDPRLPLFLNVGVWALLDPLHDMDQMLLLLEWAGRRPEDLVLELSERDLVSDLPRLAEVVGRYRRAGIRFALDDLGEGHSTFEVLTRAEPEFIKLARSLTAGHDVRGAAAAVAAVVTYASRSGATVIAEGIETEREATSMLEMGVPLGQGWLLGRPALLPVTDPPAG